MPTNTTTYSLQKPTVGGDEDAWGGYINSNLDAIDDLLDGTTPVTGIDINSGAIDGTAIGANSASTGAFTTLNVSTGLAANLSTNGYDIVTTSNADLDLAPNGTGKVVVRGNDNSGKIVLNCENNSHGVTLASPPHSASATYEVALPNALGTVNASAIVTADANGDVSFPDGEKLKLGANSDLTVYHDGSNSYLQDSGDGYLLLTSNGPGVRINSSTAEVMGDFVPNGAVTLYHDNSAKFATTAVGADVTGELIADSYNETYAAVTSSSNATTVNCHNGNAFSHTLTENTTFTFSNPPASGTAFSFSIEIIQDASASGYTVTWPSSVDWPSATAPTLTATANAKDVFVFYTRDGGTNFYGFTAGQALG